MNLKFDIHLNVGKVYRTQKPGSVEMFYTGKEIAEFVNFYNITHGVCIYDQYDHLKELMDNTDAKIYGVQWIVDKRQVLDIGKDGWYGIKLHSHRGYRDGREYDWKHPNKRRSLEEHLMCEDTRSYGMHYGDKYIYDILDKLPTGSLVYMHSQGWPSIDNRARPEHLFMLASEFMNLKFIMGHAGGYGGMLAALPGSKHTPPIRRVTGFNVYKQSLRNYGDSSIQFKAAAHYANLCHNLFLDSSCYTPDKAIALRDTDKWCIGSDYPFGANKPRNSEGNDENNHFGENDFKKPYIWNFEKQCKLFADAMGKEKVLSSFSHCLNYIERPIELLVEEQIAKMQILKNNVGSESRKYKNENKVARVA